MALSLTHLPIFACTDAEATRLDSQTNQLLEISFKLTNKFLEQYNSYHAVAHVDEKEMNLDDWGKKTHTANGLLEEVKKSTTMLQQMEDAMLANIAAVYKLFKKSHLFFIVDKDGKEHLNAEKVRESLYIFGSSIAFDQQMIKRFFPRVYPLLNYQLKDVSVIWGMSNLYGNKALRDGKPSKVSLVKHRTEDDIEESMNLMRYYINKLWGHPYVAYRP